MQYETTEHIEFVEMIFVEDLASFSSYILERKQKEETKCNKIYYR